MAAKYPVLAARVTIETGVNDVIRIDEDNGAHVFDCTLAAGDYYLAEDDSQSGSLSKAIKDALDAASAASGTPNTYDVYFFGQITPGSRSGRVVIEASDTDFQILGAHGNTTFDLTWIGFENASSSVSSSLDGTLTPSINWVSNQPMFDHLHEPQRGAAVMHETRGGQTYVYRKGAITKRRRDLFEHVCEDRIRTNLAATEALYAGALENWWESTVADGRPFRLYWTDENSGGQLNELSAADLIGTYVLDEQHIESPPAWQMMNDARLYSVTINSREYKA